MVQPTGIRQCAKGDDGSLLGPQPMQFPRRLTDQVRSVTARTTLQAANVRHPLIPMHVNREGQRCNPLSACTHSRYFASPQRLHKLTFLGKLAVHAQVHLVLSDPGLLRAFDQSQNRDAKLPAKVAQFSLGATTGDIMKERR
jgi:hypothetical protein